MSNQTSLGKGFTFIEVLVAIAVIVALAAVVFSALARFNRVQTLNSATESVHASLSEARSLTLASKSSMVYGVHFDVGSTTLFQGTAYVPGDPDNKVLALSNTVTISDISLEGGGEDVVFDRLTGKTSQFGTVTLSLNADATKTRVITIDASGIIEMQ